MIQRKIGTYYNDRYYEEEDRTHDVFIKEETSLIENLFLRCKDRTRIYTIYTEEDGGTYWFCCWGAAQGLRSEYETMESAIEAAKSIPTFNPMEDQL